MVRALVFITDFGLADGYAAELTAAAWAIQPDLRCVDGSHLIPPGDVLTAAYRGKTLGRAFGDRAVLCAVVDPGVGGDRGAVAVECDGVLWVGPDTGLVTYLWTEAGQRQAVGLEVPRGASATFQGRDLFAPVAARLAGGALLVECGTGIPAPQLDDRLVVSVADGMLSALVVCVDHFGNAITSLRRDDLGAATIEAVEWPAGRTDRVVRTYSDIGPGLAALWNSAGHLEIAAMQASAATVAGLAVGTPIVVLRR